MSSSSRRPPALLEYLIEQDFVPQAEGTWFDHDTGDGIIRVVHEPGEETQLISLATRSVCLYKAVFSPGTPGDVIIAALEAALSLRQPPETGRPGLHRSAGRRKGSSPSTAPREAGETR